MSELKSPIEILKILDKSNCRECGFPTCLAFASAVFKEQKHLVDCPHLEEDVIEKYGGHKQDVVKVEPSPEEPLEELKDRLRKVDLASAAQRLGARYANDKLTLKVCGKDFSVDSEGNFYSEIHIHSWITGPVLHYILQGAGKPLSGKWVSLRELNDGVNWYNFFVQQCEMRMKKVADTYTDLFNDMLHIFDGKRVENHYQSDISLILYPLPLVPLLVCYWEPEDGLESSLNVFFDSTANDNINIESIYSLGTGFANMFEKISLRHGY